MRLIYDIETDGLYHFVTKCHSLVLRDADNGKLVGSYADQPGYPSILEGLALLRQADEVIGHNILGYDNPVLMKLYGFTFHDRVKHRDTLVMSRLFYPEIRQKDFKRNNFPSKLIGSHSLKAWGYRLKVYKGEYGEQEDAWAVWTPEMQEYCEQDTLVTYKLLKKLENEEWPEESIQLEHDVRRIITRQEIHGFAFDMQAATHLYAELINRREELERQLRNVFKPWWRPRGFVRPKSGNLFTKSGKLAKTPYLKGCPYNKVEFVEFNPGSRDHIADRLKAYYNWKPKELTESGKPKIDETILSELKYPEAALLAEYFMIQKRIGQLAEGDQAWMTQERNGRIYGSVNTNGAVTGRMTHRNPNVAQVPSVKSKDDKVLKGLVGGYGWECRSLFTVPKGKILVGADASGLELRCLAGFLAFWDKGAYVETLLNGDIHTANQKAAGLPTRSDAKTFIYAFLYGAGDAKIGSIVGKGAKAGAQLKARFLARLKALAKLKKMIEKQLKARRKNPYLKGLDGRILPIRSAHAALNTLLQSCGAVLMKRALVILDNDLQAAGLVPGVHYEFVANVHDEWQIECDEHLGEMVGETAVKAIIKAGEYYDFKCPLDGEYKIGRTWAETH